MRVRFKKSDLLPAALAVQGVAANQSTLPILSNVLINTDHDNIVSFTATDFETRVRCEVKAEVEARGSITVPAKTFYDFVRELPDDGEVVLEAKNRGAVVSCGHIVANLQTAPVQDFPRLADLESKLSFDLGQRALRTAIGKVLFAVQVRDYRPYLRGVLFEFRPGAINLVATDGKILACSTMRLDIEGLPEGTDIIVPHKMLDELMRSLGDEGFVTVSLAEQQIGFQFNNATYVTNLVSGEYPKYASVISPTFELEFRFSRDAMASALRRTGILTDVKNPTVTLTFTPDEILVEAENFDRGRITEQVPAENEGESFTICFHHKYVADIMKNFDDSEVVLRANTPRKPAILRAPEDAETWYLVMPIAQTTQAPAAQPLTDEAGPDEEPPGGYDDAEQDES